jgi:tRNA A-37 threonylcarbamoyl transferase component Bud32
VNARGQLPAVFTPVLNALETDAAKHFRLASVRLVPASPEERPFSYVVRVDVRRHDVESSVGRLFVKVFKPKTLPEGQGSMVERVAQDFEATRRVHAWLLPHQDLGVVPPVACYPDMLTIVTEEVQGPTLLDYLRRNTTWIGGQRSIDEMSSTMATVGRWLRVFQRLDPGTTRATIDSLRAYVDHRLQRLVSETTAEFSETNRRDTLAHIDALGRCIRDDELLEVTTHSDMALGNVLVSGHRIVVLDFAMTKRGNALLDLTRLFVQMDLLAVKPQARNSIIESLQQAMIRGYDSELARDRPLFRLMLLLHRINHLATLSVKRAPFMEGLYNGVIRRHHRQWLAAELRRGPAVGVRT